MLDGLMTDLRMAARALARSPGFTLSASLVLALGIGANTTVFSALRATVLADVPYPDADRLVLADLTVQRGGEAPEPLIWSFPKFLAFLEMEGRTIDPAVGYASRTATLTELGSPEVVTLELVTPGYFELLGRPPQVGRAFDRAELVPANTPEVAVISAAVWRARFGADPGAIGRTITLNGRLFEVVGVAPDGFDGVTGGATIWIPMGAAGTLFTPFMVEEPGAHWFHVLGRLTDGTSVDHARDQMVALGDAIAESYPPPNPGRVFSGSARSLTEARSNPDAHASVVFLSLAAALVLLVACANLSGLLLARARTRARDGAVRVAVGASRWRLVRASMVESVLLALLGGIAGITSAVFGTRAMAAAWPRRFTSGEADMRIVDPSALGVDQGVLGFALLATLVTALLFGLAPALRVSRADVGARLRDGAGGTRRTGRVLGLDARAALVSSQIALALVLLIGVGLMAETTLRLLRVDEGFRTERLLTFTYSIPTSNSAASEPILLHDRFLEEIRALPGVEAATLGCPPLRGHCIITRVDAVRGAPEIPPGEGLEIGAHLVDHEHFAALGIAVREGRTFDDRDGTDSSPTIVLNERAARALFPDGDAVGQFIELGLGSDDRDPMAEVIGVVADVLYNRPDVGVMPEAYYSYREFPENHGNVTVRTAGEPLALLPALRATLEGIDPTLALYRAETMDRVMASSIGDRRTTLGLLGVFAVVTILLAATGTWGIVAYSVADRRRELGLRLALGAKRSGVVGSVLREGTRTAALGVLGGLLLGLVSSRLLETLLWQTERLNPAVYAGGALLLFAIVLVASWLPARRAARVDPVEALKAE